MRGEPRRLHTGAVVDSYSLEWLLECFAVELLAMPLDTRKAWLAQLEEKRGESFTAKLKVTMQGVFDARKVKTS